MYCWIRHSHWLSGPRRRGQVPSTLTTVVALDSDTDADATAEVELVAPVAAIRASRSAAVVQVTVVPAARTSGRGTHMVRAA